LPRVDPAEEEKKAGRPRFPYRPLQGGCSGSGGRKLERLNENIAADIELKPDDLSDSDNAMSRITVVGNRY